MDRIVTIEMLFRDLKCVSKSDAPTSSLCKQIIDGLKTKVG